MTKEIAKLLVLAQAGSDEGKNISDLSFALKQKLYDKAWIGYPEKDRAIYELIQLIRRYPQKDIHYYVCRDTQKVSKYIVYFDVCYKKQFRQISFHSFDSRLGKYLSGCRKSHTEWACWQSSRDNAYWLAEQFGLLK